MFFVRIIGRDVALKENALSQQHCDSVMKVYAENKKKIMDKDSGHYPNDTRYFDCNVSSLKYPKMYNLFKNSLDELLTEYYQSIGVQSSLVSKIERFTLMCFPKNTGEFNHHVDSQGNLFGRRLVVIWYLNDVSDGGRLVLPSKEHPIEIVPTLGTALICPTDWTHHHFVTKPMSNDRYSMLTFLHH
jgi:hypothetical protein